MLSSFLKRRKFLGGLMLGLLLSQLFNPTILAEEDESITIQWRVPREQVPTVRDNLEFQGEIIPDKSTIEDDRGLPLIYIFVGVVTLDSVAKTVLDIYKDAKYGGVIIRRDEKGELLIENNPSLDKGTIVIDQGDDVKVVFEENEQPQEIKLLEALIPLIKK